MPRAKHQEIYDVLVREAGATDDAGNRLQWYAFWKKRFDLREYRFIGLLGFGGKVWFSRPEVAPYVNCYAEDMNDERRDIIERTNAALERLHKS